MTPRILITEPIIESVIHKLKDHYDVTVGERGEFWNETALIEAIPEYDGLLSMLSSPVSADVIAAGSKLKIVANHAVGYNNIDLKAAEKAGVFVANTPDVLTESTADYTLALMLATGRKICDAQQYLRNGEFEGWEPLGFLGLELNKKTLGIYGMGRIGAAVARSARYFGMNIIYHNRSRIDEQTEKELDAEYVAELEELARRSDVLSVNCPLTDETHHTIDRKILTLMPSHALLINTARGPVIKEDDLAKALHNGDIGGAGLDVFEEEPKIHPRLFTAPNCVMTPHIASATRETREAIGMLAVNAIIGVLEGKRPEEIPNLIQP